MKWSGKSHAEFEQAPVGTHAARCIKIIDIGTHESEYQGAANIRRQCVIVFELPEAMMTHGESAGKPFIVSKFYTASLNEKATLRKDLVCWRGREFSETELEGFEAKNILDKTCLLSITANDKGKSRIAGIMALPKRQVLPPRVNDLVYFSLDEFDHKVFESLSEGYKKLITESPEYHRLMKDAHKPDVADETGSQAPGYDDDVPF